MCVCVYALVWAPLLEHAEESGAWESSGMEKIAFKEWKILLEKFLFFLSSFPVILKNYPAISFLIFFKLLEPQILADRIE